MDQEDLVHPKVLPRQALRQPQTVQKDLRVQWVHWVQLAQQVPVLQQILEVLEVRSLQASQQVPADCRADPRDQAFRPAQLAQVALEAPLVRSVHLAPKLQ